MLKGNGAELRVDQPHFERTFSIQHDEKNRPFWIERPPLFSSAAAAQEIANSSRIWRQWGDTFIAWQYGEWVDEALAVYRSAFLGDWSAISKVTVKGPEAQKFLEHVGVADLSRLEVGHLRHFVMCNEVGKIATEGVLVRIAHDEYYYTAGGGEWLTYQIGLGRWDATVELDTAKNFIFELQGHRSIDILERATVNKLRQLEFNRWTAGSIAGADVRILRTGISGELGYEIHGPSACGAIVWQGIVEAGAEYDLRPLGMRSQVLCHIEAGIATCGFDYMPSSIGTPGGSTTSVSGPGQTIRATYPIKAVDDLLRSPLELNWCSRKVIETRDFIGANALRSELGTDGPRRRLFGLVWNTNDVMEVYASLFKDGTIAPQMDLPRRYAAEYFAVNWGGSLVGCATSRVYSPKLRRMISLAVLDQEVATPGREVTVLWGGSTNEAVEVRAEIVPLPFKPDRRRETPV